MKRNIFSCIVVYLGVKCVSLSGKTLVETVDVVPHFLLNQR